MRFIPAYGDPYTPDEVADYTARERYMPDSQDRRYYRADDDMEHDEEEDDEDEYM